MRIKLSKIILIALTLVLVFGAVPTMAYESYDTYTYSIDGEPLKSPAAYTPDFVTYDSEKMGLLAGNTWAYGQNGEPGYWSGMSMQPKAFEYKNASAYLVYELNSDGKSYSVAGFDADAYTANIGMAGSLIAIPTTYTSAEIKEPYPVTAVKAGAFDTVDDIYRMVSAILLGGNIKEIGDNAFGDFSGATVYNYSESVKYGNKELSDTSADMVADNDGNIYIVDKGNNRIVVLNKRDFKAIGVIGEYVDEYNRPQSLKNPWGIYVTDPEKMVDSDEREIYVCDTDNKRIVVFDDNFQYKRTIEEPKSALIDHDDFQLHAIAVDIYGRIFAISHNCYQGVMVLSDRGEFIGFIGAQQVTVDPIKQLWDKYFTTAEQREDDIKNLSTPYNNITVDDSGFVYVTINFDKLADLNNQLKAITSKSPGYSPVKKLNSTGIEIMKRNGFFDPGGEVILESDATKTVDDLSVIKDVAIGNEGSWSLLDTKRSRIFTYDSNGNLLFAFGDKGDQVGNGEEYIAMTYQVLNGEYNLVLLDKSGTGVKVIVYHPTEYCDTIMSALHNENVHNHSASIDDWQDVLTRNNNFDLAYIGIGKALYNQGEYEKAMKMLSSAYETDYYAKAFAEIRKDIISVWMIPLIIGVIALLMLFFKFLGWAKKKNKATSLKVGRKTYVEELLYICHLVFHPFDGFWDLKHEKRGSVRAATTIIGVTILAFFYQAIGQGYMFNTRGDYSTVFIQVISVLVPILLWVISNWCLTTLFDGEGSLKDIYIATCYSIAPLPLFVILSTILTNVFTISEGSMVTLLVTIGYVWVGLLLFFGMSVTHDYSIGKNIITILGTIVAMAVIMFIAILFSSLVVKMVTFVVAIVTELISLM